MKMQRNFYKLYLISKRRNVRYIFHFSATSQIWSIPFSFLSLARASNKIFYSQRLGQLFEHSPSLTMTLVASLPNFFIITSSLFSYVIVAIYFKGFVLVPVLVICAANFIFLGKNIWGKKLRQEIIDFLYDKQKQYGTKESQLIFFNTILTSWISPCTVWFSNLRKKSKFLLISSLINAVVHGLCIVCVICLTKFLPLIIQSSPPITHCLQQEFEHTFSTSEFRYYFSQNESSQILIICKKCLPAIRICADGESPTDILFYFISPIWVFLIVVSFGLSCLLHTVSSYPTLFHWSRKINFACSRMLFNLLKDYIHHPFHWSEKTEEILQNYLNNKKCQFSESEYQEVKGILEKKMKQKSLIDEEEEILLRILEYVQALEPEKINKENICIWDNPLMQKAVESSSYKTLFLLNIFGGHWLAHSHKEKKSCIHVLMEKIERQSQNINPIINWSFDSANKKYGENALHNAAKDGNNILLELLIMNGVDVNLKDTSTLTPLSSAAMQGNTDSARLLLDNEADIDATNHEGDTALHFAARYGFVEIVRILILYTATIDAKNSNDETPLHLALTVGAFECAKLLIDEGAKLDVKDNKGKTPSMVLQDYVEQQTSNKNETKNKKPKRNRRTTAAHLAAIFQNNALLEILINQKAELNVEDKSGYRPINYAIKKIAEELNVKSTKKLNASDKSLQADLKSKPLFELLMRNLKPEEVNIKNKDGDTLFHDLIALGRTDLLKLLIESGADVNLQGNFGVSPLHYVAKLGNIECLELLLEIKNANVNVKDELDSTPLQYAASYGKADCLQRLISKSAALDTHKENCTTPLHGAVRFGHFDCVKVLTENNASVNSTDNDDFTPLHWAALHRRVDCIGHLIEKSADVNARNVKNETPLHLVAFYLDEKDKEKVQIRPKRVESKMERHMKMLEQLRLHPTESSDDEETKKELIRKMMRQLINDDDDDEVDDSNETETENETEKCIEILLRNGADVNATDETGRKPSDSELVQELMKKISENK